MEMKEDCSCGIMDSGTTGHTHHHEGDCGCGHSHSHHHSHGIKAFVAPAVSLVMLAAGLLMHHVGFHPFVTGGWIELCWYLAAFIPVGYPVIKEALEGIAHHDYFNEFTLMVIACVGAFCIREFPEAVGVMLFYSIGETLQHEAVDRATRNISRLLDVRGEHANVVRGDKIESVDPKSVEVGAIIEVRPGERVPLDGIMESENGLFDTSALTGESMPREIARGGEVLAGMISSSGRIRMIVERGYGESALSRILEMVSHASERKAHTELFIRKFARIYTPVVIALAVLVMAVPAVVSLFNPSFHYVFSEWLYRSLVFLVISCPCALVVSVPLGYFAGIGAASRAGILFKGGNYLDAMARVNTVAFDKTGTLTTGKFRVEEVMVADEPVLALIAAAESASTHPLARTLVDYVDGLGIHIPQATSMHEKAGHGVVAMVGGKRVVAGNRKLLLSEGIEYEAEPGSESSTIIACAIDGEYKGYVGFADTLKEDAPDAVRGLRELGVDRIVMLSGDKRKTVEEFARRLDIHESHGELLPQDKAEFVENIARTPGRRIAFVGDGMNDAPVLALSDVGVAMGGLGSDAAIESADVVVQTDLPSRVATAIRISRLTHTIVMENIVGAIGIKVVVLALGSAGYASLWAAVFADVGVALLAVLNSMRIMWKKHVDQAPIHNKY